MPAKLWFLCEVSYGVGLYSRDTESRYRLLYKLPYFKLKVNGKGPDTCYSASYMSTWPEALYNLGSGSWLAWANDTAAHYAAIHCLRQRTIGPAVLQLADTPPPQSAPLGLHPVARKLLLISRPAEGRRLSKYLGGAKLTRPICYWTDTCSRLVSVYCLVSRSNWLCV